MQNVLKSVTVSVLVRAQVTGKVKKCGDHETCLQRQCVMDRPLEKKIGEGWGFLACKVFSSFYPVCKNFLTPIEIFMALTPCRILFPSLLTSHK